MRFYLALENGWYSWTWDNWDSFLSWLDGTDTEMFQSGITVDAAHWPNSSGWVFGNTNAHHIASSVAQLHDDKNRRIDLDGTEHRDYEQGARIAVSQVDSGDLADVINKHGITPDHIVTGG